MRLMTYNILEGGRSHGDRLDAVTGIIAENAPDVLALNECNGFLDDGGRTTYELERQLGMRSLIAETRTGFHVALFVRGHDILEAHPMVDWFHHGALRVKLRLGQEEITVMTTHLCPYSSESRVREAQYLASHVRDEHVVVMGDMNAISRHDVERMAIDQMLPYRKSRHVIPGTETPDTRAMDIFESAGLVDLWQSAHPGKDGATLPTPLTDDSSRPELRVDYILGTPALQKKLTDCNVLVTEATKAASDHFPIVADLSL